MRRAHSTADAHPKHSRIPPLPYRSLAQPSVRRVMGLLASTPHGPLNNLPPSATHTACVINSRPRWGDRAGETGPAGSGLEGWEQSASLRDTRPAQAKPGWTEGPGTRVGGIGEMEGWRDRGIEGQRMEGWRASRGERTRHARQPRLNAHQRSSNTVTTGSERQLSHSRINRLV